MNDHNPTDPKQPGSENAASHPANDPQDDPAFYEADTRPSIGTLQSMQQDSPQQDHAQQDETPSVDSAADDLAALRSQSQSFMGTAPTLSQPPAPTPVPISSDSASTEAEMAKAANVQERYGDRLLQLPHVVGVGIGYLKVGDQVTTQIALVVMVDQKVEADQQQPDQRIPSQLEGVPVMVQEVGTFTAF